MIFLLYSFSCLKAQNEMIFLGIEVIMFFNEPWTIPRKITSKNQLQYNKCVNNVWQSGFSLYELMFFYKP